MRDNVTNPYQNTSTARLIADRIRDLAHRKTQAEIASEAGFPNAKMMTFLKNGRNQVQLDRVPSLAKALEVDPAYLMRLALEHPCRLQTEVIVYLSELFSCQNLCRILCQRDP